MAAGGVWPQNCKIFNYNIFPFNIVNNVNNEEGFPTKVKLSNLSQNV